MDTDPQLDAASPAPSPADDAPPPSEDSARFALYDTAHRRFVGRVYDSRPSKAEVARVSKANGGRDIEARRV